MLRKNDKEEFVITIDGDDALSIKKLDSGNYLFEVHIANPIRIMEDNLNHIAIRKFLLGKRLVKVKND